MTERLADAHLESLHILDHTGLTTPYPRGTLRLIPVTASTGNLADRAFVVCRKTGGVVCHEVPVRSSLIGACLGQPNIGIGHPVLAVQALEGIPCHVCVRTVCSPLLPEILEEIRSLCVETGGEVEGRPFRNRVGNTKPRA